MFVALMTAGANISIPFFPVPLTFQTVISVAAGLMLGPKKGFASMAAYCFMGLVGIPVFTGFGGGIAYVLKPTFGYILGFAFSAVVAGTIVNGKTPKLKLYVVSAIAAFLAGYAVGIPYFALIWRFYLNSPSLGEYIISYNLLYMPKDFALCVLAAMVARYVAPRLARIRAKRAQGARQAERDGGELKL